MMKQVMISISREFGTGGHTIARIIAQDLGINLYDRSLLDEIAKQKGIQVENLERYDERTNIPVVSRSVREYSNSPEDVLAAMQFEFLQSRADAGESFVVVGRCAETALEGREGLITIFILGDKKDKIKNVQEKFGLSEKEALRKMTHHDLARKSYHNRHSTWKWGDSRGYDMCINDSRLGIEKSVALIEHYVQERMNGEA